jgi:hypothetical protein
MPRPIAKTLHIDRRAHKIVARADDETRNIDDLLNVTETADYLDVSPQWLAIRRGQNNGPKFKRVSARKIMYRVADILAWLESRTHRSTKEYAKRRAAR